MCFGRFRFHLCKTEMPEPRFLEDIDFNEIYTLLYSHYPETPIYISDSKYKTTSVSELIRFLLYDLTDKYKYDKELYDCDDFSFSLMGGINNPKWGALSFGIMWTNREGGTPHALNFFIDKERKIYAVEPQNDYVYRIPVIYKPYLLVI